MNDGRTSRFRWSLVSLIKVAILAWPLGLVIQLLNHNFFIFPTLSYSFQPGKTKQVVSAEYPGSLVRTAEAGKPWKMTTDSFAFSVRIPRLIESIRVRLKLENVSQPVVTLTAKGADAADDETTIIYSEYLEGLSWPRISDGQLTLWTNPVAPQKYQSVAEFWQQPPPSGHTAFVDLDPLSNFSLPGYQPSSNPIFLPRTIRGSHRLYLYAGRETIKMNFEQLDINRKPGADGVTVRIGRASDSTDGKKRWLSVTKFFDDKDKTVSGHVSDAVAREVAFDNDRPGVFIVDIKASDDALLRNFRFWQHYVAFDRRVYVADGPGYVRGRKFEPFSVRTNASFIGVAPDHEVGLQIVRTGGRAIPLDAVRAVRKIEGVSAATPITIEKGDLVLTSESFITFDPAQLFPGRLDRRWQASDEPDLRKTDYLLAPYVPTGKEKGVMRSDQTYPLSQLLLTTNQAHFVINATGLERHRHVVHIKQIRATLHRGPFPWLKVLNKVGL